MQVVLISGLSGSGKSVALKVLEDAGYYAIDNLPANLLPHLVRELELEGYERAAVAVDVRTGASIAAVPRLIEELRPTVDDLRVIFLDARDDTLIARFSETRRSHPLAADDVSLAEAIERERDLLEPVAELGHRIDTSDLQANTLRTWIKDVMGIESSAGLTLMFQSFGFKYGIPLDADLVFDVRCLPNPHYEKALRPLTGRDQPVIEFLERIPEVGRMCLDITRFLANWLPAYARDNRSYLTVAIGCTGGQHRSVYIAEWLGRHFEDTMRVLVRHRSSARRGIDHGPTSARQ